MNIQEGATETLTELEKWAEMMAYELEHPEPYEKEQKELEFDV